MNSTPIPEGIKRRSWTLRFVDMMISCGIITALLLPLTLTPDPSGMGTHRQLGLPPCLFWSLFHLKCPSCGLTTSFSHWVRGDFIQSFQCNPMGPILYIVLAGAALLFGARAFFPQIASRFFLSTHLRTMIHCLLVLWCFSWLLNLK